MTLRILVAILGLAAISLAAQAPPGEIAGRMSDEQRSAIPGVRIRMTTGNESTEAVTDREGRFLFRSLTMGTYRVVAELAGFKTASGEIVIARSTPRGFLAWSLEVGCLADVQRVVLRPRDAARRVEAVVHIRVEGTHGPVLMSVDPDCPGRVFQEFAVQVLGAVTGRGRRNSGPRQIFMEPRDARLTPGHEYLALLWPDGYATSDLVLPIVSGRVMSPNGGI